MKFRAILGAVVHCLSALVSIVSGTSVLLDLVVYNEFNNVNSGVFGLSVVCFFSVWLGINLGTHSERERWIKRLK